jgi:hypothetical protein
MSYTFVMLVVVSGLGCQNKPAPSSDLPVITNAAPASPSVEALSGSTTPPPYPRYFPETFPDPEAAYSNHLSSLRATLYSFVFGKDPGIPSAREIEASVYGYGNGNHSP